MKLLIIGDIYGEKGIDIIKNKLSIIVSQFDINFVIANGENVSFNGKSLSKKHYDILMKMGVNYFTMGNHTFKNIEINNYIDEIDNLVRPANYVDEHKGKGFLIFEFNGKKILLLNLLGTNFMNEKLKNPFYVSEDILSNNEYDYAIIDFHAETTSEKIVLANYLSKKFPKLKIFYGTHTHVQTSDERIINDDTLFITDIGLTGIVDSAIGADFENVTNRLLNKRHGRFLEAKNGRTIFCGLYVEIDEKTNKIKDFKRLNLMEK